MLIFQHFLAFPYLVFFLFFVYKMWCWGEKNFGKNRPAVTKMAVKKQKQSLLTAWKV